MKKVQSAGIVILVSIFMFACASKLISSDKFPQRVLITNDNGIEDIKIIELAKAFSTIAETYVIAPLEDKSGISHYIGAINNGFVKVEQRKIGNGIIAYPYNVS